jgi:hypothetical protein
MKPQVPRSASIQSTSLATVSCSGNALVRGESYKILFSQYNFFVRSSTFDSKFPSLRKKFSGDEANCSARAIFSGFANFMPHNSEAQLLYMRRCVLNVSQRMFSM